MSLEELRGYDECAMRFWLQGLLEGGERRSENAVDGWWRDLLSEIAEQGSLEPESLDSLAERYPRASEWLDCHRALLLSLSFGVRLPFGDSEAAEARLDAAVTEGNEAFIYGFSAPGSLTDEDGAREYLEGRWTELWAAGHMLRRYRGRIAKVRLLAWPVLADPIEAYPGGIRSPWRRIEYRTERAQAALERMAKGEISPSPGFQCGGCMVRDACREGAL